MRRRRRRRAGRRGWPRRARPGPACGRTRSAASASASRTASISCAGEASRPSSRSSRATRASQRSTMRSSVAEQVVVPAGRGHARAVARSNDSRPYVHGTQVARTRVRGQALQQRLVGVRPGRATSSAGACHAPQTNGDPLEALLARRADALAHVRLALGLARVVLGRAARCARPHRLADGLEEAGASRRCSTIRSHQRSPSSIPAASASSGQRVGRPPSRAVVAAASAPSWADCGRSMNRAGTPRSAAWRSACHSGRERGERDRRPPASDVVRRVDEQRHRRPHARVGDQRDSASWRRAGLRSGRRRARARRAPRAGCAPARAVVADAEDDVARPRALRRPRGRRGTGPSSRRAP